MTTSAAALHTFMGYKHLPISRLGLALLNIRMGIIAANPKSKCWSPIFWPAYTFMEFFGISDTHRRRLQLSDGGHIENLGIYELLRRRVKTIIAVDAGEDSKFDFFDLRNLVIRARNELGLSITFEDHQNPLQSLRPNKITGASQKHFVIGRITGLPGAYAKEFSIIIFTGSF